MNPMVIKPVFIIRKFILQFFQTFIRLAFHKFSLVDISKELETELVGTFVNMVTVDVTEYALR